MIGIFGGITKKGFYIRRYHGNNEIINSIFDCDNNYIRENLYSFEKAITDGEYCRRWQDIKKKYRTIKVCAIYYSFIGEFISRALIINNYELRKDEYIVVIPQMSYNRVANRYVVSFLNKRLNPRIEFIDESNLAFWRFVFNNHYKDLDFSVLKKYSETRGYELSREAYNGYLDFSDEEIRVGEEKKNEYGIADKYVCIAARTATYNDKTGNSIEKNMNYNYRNMNFDTYKLAISYLHQNGIQTVKMGREENKCQHYEGLVDYAGAYANDFMDLFLAGNCKFFVCCPSGVNMLAGLFAVPQLFVNAVVVSYSGGGSVDTNNNYIIMKKVYDNKKKKYLSIREFIEIERKSLANGDYFEKLNIIFEDNSADEILDAVREVNDRLDGVWVDTEQDIIYMERYNSLYEEMKKTLPEKMNDWGGPWPARMCATFLRKNAYLLD